MIIDPETGGLSICGRNFVGGDDVQTALSVKDAETTDMDTGYFWVKLRELQNIANLCFFHGKLKRLHLYICSDDDPSDWDNWDETKEREKVLSFRKWLSTHLGKPSGKKSWGSWQASYDEKSACSLMVISYD